MRKWLAKKLYPQVFHDADRYVRMKVEAIDAYHWLNGYPQAAKTLRWLLDNDFNRNRNIGDKAIGEFPSSISDFRTHLERERQEG